MPSEILKVDDKGKLTPQWHVTWCPPNREPLLGTATHVKGNGTKKYLVKFNRGEKWIKETQLEF